ncbi:MAG: diguanylate cyclase [Blautia sp.]|nr:diguanylate cyclase [Blautia sp.]
MSKEKRLTAGCFFFLFFFALAYLNVRADDGGLFIDSNAQEVYTYAEGLPGTSSTAITQTEDGFIWIGSYAGLARYDGRVFETFDAGDLMNISDLMPDTKDALWIASVDRGLVHYDDGQLTYLSEEMGVYGIEAESLAKGPDGTIYLGTTEGVWELKEGASLEKLTLGEPDTRFIAKIRCLQDGRMIYMTRDHRMYLQEAENRQIREITKPFGYFRPRCVFCQESSGRFYVGTDENKVFVLDDSCEAVEEITIEGLQCINDIYCAGEDLLYICSDRGVAVYDHGRIRLQRLKINNSVDQMLRDREGNLWFMSSRQGILKVSQGKFGNISQSAGLESMVVNAVEMIGNRLYIGQDKGLEILSTSTCETMIDPVFNRFSSMRVRAVHGDEDGGVWIATTGNGLFHYTGGKGWVTYGTRQYPKVITSDNFRCLIPDGEDMLAGTDSGAYRITTEKAENVLEDPKEMNCRVLSVLPLGEITLYGTDGYGIHVVKDRKVVRRITTADGLPSNVIMKFCRGRKYDVVYMVTGNGIAYLDEDLKTHQMERLVNSNKLDFLLPEDGSALILTGSGIVRTTEEKLMEGKNDFLFYQHQDGLPFEITANSNQCISGDTLYFCGSEGLGSLRMDYGKENEQKQDYQLVIDKVAADGKKMYVQNTGKCVLDENIQRIEINAHVLTYRLENLKVFYFLEGFDQTRTVERLQKLENISYTNLPGGSYTLHFGIVDNESQEVLQEILFPIKKEKKLIERTEIHVLLLILGAGLVSGIMALLFRARSKRHDRRLKEKYEQKEKEHLQEIAYKDYLTGLYNRNYLEVWNEKVLPGAAFPITFLSIDSNDLKKINDIYGHKSGDIYLQHIADILKRNFEGEDYTIFRLGGDEYLVLCTGVAEEEAWEKAQKARTQASEVYVENVPITFCLGSCSMDQEHFNFDEGMRLSDLRMLEEKDIVHGRKSKD